MFLQEFKIAKINRRSSIISWPFDRTSWSRTAVELLPPINQTVLLLLLLPYEINAALARTTETAGCRGGWEKGDEGCASGEDGGQERADHREDHAHTGAFPVPPRAWMGMGSSCRALHGSSSLLAPSLNPSPSPRTGRDARGEQRRD
jgi:hypothetical protein